MGKGGGFLQVVASAGGVCTDRCENARPFPLCWALVMGIPAALGGEDPRTVQGVTTPTVARGKARRLGARVLGCAHRAGAHGFL